jgi:predicted aminopeptidase
VRFGAFIQKAVARVEALYQRPDLSREEKLKEREVLFKALQAESLALGLETDAYSSFATRPLDNAVLLSYRRYSSGQELFDALYEHCGGNLASAMKIVKTLDPARARGDARRQSPFERLEQWLKDGGSCSPSP